ncbi:uncharacterized protein LOC34618655 [Cyclospora cayetanensis]|uniref:Uncharacterized protein LOC34618655 n=1 Tax=Cyclospora cayetanensis TaxID=88456 RepID=A0A6P6RQ54_9EIME|nr:uncharacterized protein LOC34618655 [Cyclospora cayetanensis]
MSSAAPPAAAKAQRRLDKSFAVAAATAVAEGRVPPTHWGDTEELCRQFPADSPDVQDLNAISHQQLPLPDGAVCRYLCFVQQPLNVECFIGAVCRNGVWESSKFREALPEPAPAGSNSLLWTRHAFRCCLSPGAAPWWHQPRRQHQKQLALRECILLLYPKEGEPLPNLNDVIEIVELRLQGPQNEWPRGLPVADPCIPSSVASEARPPWERFTFTCELCDALALAAAPYAGATGLHEAPKANPKSAFATSTYWSCALLVCFEGDAVAAEYALLTLCSRPSLQQQQEGGSAEDCPVAGPPVATTEACVCSLHTAATRRLLNACRELVPFAALVSAHEEALVMHALGPHLQLADDDLSEDLLSAAPLQLPPGCALIIDQPHSLERRRLNAFVRQRCAVAAATTKKEWEQQQQQQQKEQQQQQQKIGANLAALQMLIADGAVPYDFLTGVRSIETDCCVLLVTHEESVSHFEGLVDVPIHPTEGWKSSDEMRQRQERSRLEELRQYVAAARGGSRVVQLHEELRERAISDFVKKRQLYDDVSSSDFEHWVLVAAAVAASHGSFMTNEEEEAKGENAAGTHTKRCANEQTVTAAGERPSAVLVKLEHWEKAQALEDERRSRLRALKRRQEAKEEKDRDRHEAEEALASHTAKLSIV